MIYQRGHLARPLDAVFSSASRLAVLRQLRGFAEGKSGRVIARLAGLNHQTAALALADLAAKGIVERRSWGAREVLWRLNRSRWEVTQLIEPLLEKEAQLPFALADMIRELVKRSGAKGSLLHGETAKGKLAPGKPLKLGLVGGGRKGAEGLRALAAELKLRYGLELEGKVITEAQAMHLSAFDDTWRIIPDEGRHWVPSARPGR
jgi:hypothetical protein